MVKAFFDIFIAFLSAAVFGGIVITSWILVLGHGFPEAMLAVLVWVIFCFFIFGKLSRARLNKLGNLMNDCKIEEYVDAYDKLVGKAFGSDGKRIGFMNQARGLIVYGAVDEAIEVLDTIYIPEKRKPKEMHQTALLNMTYFNAYIEKGDLEKATEALAVCRYMTQDSVYTEPYKTIMTELCKRADARLALARGEFDGMEEVYYDILKDSYAKLDKVIGHYRLAEIAEHFGNEEDRTEHLEYVSDNGGTSIYKYYADKALNGEPVQDGMIYVYGEDK